MEENCCNLASVVFWAVGPRVFCVLTAWKAEMNCQIILWTQTDDRRLHFSFLKAYKLVLSM